MDAELVHLVALHQVPGIGDSLFRQLITRFGSGTETFRQSPGKLRKLPGLSDQAVQSIRRHDTLKAAEQEVRRAEKLQTELIFFNDRHYPTRLKAIDDAPALIYVQGNANLNHPRTVGIVGTRNATPYGRAIVEQLIAGLEPLQVVVISGLAYGIDISAHKQSLLHRIPTIGILGSGLDVIYPSLHFETAMQMKELGGLVTENPFGTSPDAHRFPARNRIIAGLCDALIVVEAGQKGGALITADIANSYNKDVFAVPGSVGAPYSEGCNHLIKTHRASLLTSVTDIEYIMGWRSQPNAIPQLSLDLFTEGEQQILGVLRDHKSPVPVDFLAAVTGMLPGELASALLNLEMVRAISALPGKTYRLGQRRP